MSANILMVEDDQALLEFYAAALSPGYTVLTATNVPEAKRVLEERSVDAVVCVCTWSARAVWTCWHGSRPASRT